MKNIYYVAVLSIVIIILVAIIRAKVEARFINTKLTNWKQWLVSKPNLQQYQLKYNQEKNKPFCFYCGEIRVHNSLEMVTVAKFKPGLFSNKSSGYLYWRSYYCSKCQTELYREVEEKNI